MAKFIIAGLPRSGTTWLSVFLTTDSVTCLHDPSARYSPEELAEWDEGISDTGVWFYPEWCQDNTDKFIIIDRDREEVNKSLSFYSLPLVDDRMYSFFLEARNKADRVISFVNLFTEKGIQEIWESIYPNIPFNYTRWQQLRQVYMSPIALEKRDA